MMSEWTKYLLETSRHLLESNPDCNNEILKQFDEISKFTNQLIDRINNNLEKFNYKLVCCNITGSNAFLVNLLN